MEDNRSIVEKADLALASLTTGGLLNTAQADRFIQLAIKEAVAMPLMTLVNMRSPTESREKIQFGSRVLRKGTEAVALPLAQRSTPTTSKVDLSAQLVKAEARISYEVLEDTIERGNFQDTIMDTLGAAISRDLEDLAFNGDTTSADALLQTLDGFVKQATTNIVAGGSATLQRSILRDMLTSMPVEFRKDKRNMRYFSADGAVIRYQEHLADRATDLGDDQVQALAVRPFHQIPLIGVPVFPTTLGGTSDETVVVLVDPGNMLFGVWRDIRMEQDKDISAGQLIIVVTARVDFKFAHEPAVVKATAVKAA